MSGVMVRAEVIVEVLVCAQGSRILLRLKFTLGEDDVKHESIPNSVATLYSTSQ